MKKLRDIIYNKLPMQVLSYLTKQREGNAIYGSKIADTLSVSQGATSTFLRQLQSVGLLQSQNLGRTLVYNVDSGNPLLRHFRIFDNLLEITGLINEIKQYCRKIILFGSCARGEDTYDSDIDLFIVADGDYHDIIRKTLSDFQTEREIKPVITDSLELIDMEQNDKVFIEEVNKGIELWGGQCE